MNSFLREVCLENITFLEKAIAAGADRIELCDNLAVGGTTVSYGVARQAAKKCKGASVQLMGIVRPRGGNFIYTKEELAIMESDIHILKELGFDGVVLGCLTEKGYVDEEAMARMLAAAKGLEATFHMAFDVAEDPFQTLDILIKLGVNRVLMHGPNKDILENVEFIRRCIAYSDGRMIIMPGGGITSSNADYIHTATGATELHGTRILW
ncbi:copper homeostasis protein CutC [Bacillus sp. JCM 19041]|uniref:copper homeostasis protein CutC n=1 Tax=Bacillus sp. JCM 19041 TaxID=1460637 RepID=UPI0006D200E2